MPLLSRVLIIIAVAQSWVAAYWLFRRVLAQHGHSISRHGGASLATYLVFALTLTFHALAFSLFSTAWLIPRYQLPATAAAVLALGVICLLLTAWIRDGTNHALHLWHVAVAYTMAATIPLNIIFLLASARLAPLSQISCWVCLVIAVAFWITFGAVKQIRSHYLWYQSAYILSFQFSLIAVAIGV